MSSVAQIIRRRRNRKARQNHSRSRSQIWAYFVFGGIAVLLLIPLSLLSFLYLRAVQYFPSPADTIYLDPIIQTTNFYERTGSVLLYSVQDPLGDERLWVDVETLPEYVLSATLQMEDPDFLETGGFDIGRTISRLWRYALGTEQRRDSSLAGRLAENALVPPARDSQLDESLLHLVFSTEVQRRYSPRRVLEWYLNTAYYGNDAYGIDAAAQVYFGKSAQELSLDEATLLAAIPLAPQYNPLDNEQAARDRQINLLRDMRAYGWISDAEFDSVASIATIVRTDLAQPPYIAPEFSLYAREQAETILNGLGMDGARLISRGGLRITTSLDLETYYQSECIMRAHLAQLNGQNPLDTLTLAAQPCIGANYLSSVTGVNPTTLPNQGRLIVLDVQTGEIMALVGDATGHNLQAGPTMYPYIYLTGFLEGHYTPARMVLDIPTTFPGATENSIYNPINPDGLFRGPMNLRDAMASGLRVPVVSVANREGINDILYNAHKLGLNSFVDLSSYDLSLVGGNGNVSVLDISYSYSVFASMGRLQGISVSPIAQDFRANDPVAILKIVDPNGNVLWEYSNEIIAVSSVSKLEPEFAFLVNDILADSGTRSRVLGTSEATLDIGRPAAIVNGLTGDATGAWTVGYTPQLVVGVQFDREDNQRLSVDNYNLQGTAPVWQAVMQYANAAYNFDSRVWPRPTDIVEVTVCDISGMLPQQGIDCPRHNEIFHPKVLPSQHDIYWETVEINSSTRQRAADSTPSHLRLSQTYFIPPADALEWWQRMGRPLPPTEYDTMSLPEVLSSVQIFVPQDLSFVSGVVDVRGAMDATQMQSYQLRYSQGLASLNTNWIALGGLQTSFTEGTSLGLWDTSGLDGTYTLELLVSDRNNRDDRAAVRVTVDNQAPTIKLLAGENGETLFRWPQQTVIPLQADVDDNLALDRVEFFRNGTLLDVVESAPYEWIFTIEGVGIEIFQATVFDQAGNQASAEIEVEVIRSGSAGQ
jgi:penicillin-binding protein 1A